MDQNNFKSYNNNQQNPYGNYPPQYGYTQQVYRAPTPPDPRYQEEMRRQLYLSELARRERTDILKEGFWVGGALVLLIVIEMAISITLMMIGNNRSLMDTSSLFQSSLNLAAVHLTSMPFAFWLLSRIQKNKYKRRVIPTEKVGFVRSAAWVSFGLGVCMLANILTEAVIKLAELIGYKLTLPDVVPPKSLIEYIALIAATAVAPAVFEEYAMRCCTLGILRNHGKAFGIITVSVIFGIMHNNVIQFVFAFTVGLVLGYATEKTGSVIPAMFIHGLNNGLSVLQSILKSTSGEKVADNITSAVIVLFFVASVWGLIYLIVKKEFKPEKRSTFKNPYGPSGLVKALLMAPGLLVPFCIMLYFTSEYVTKI